MHSIKLQWKPFKVHLPSLERSLKAAAGQHYVGNTADEILNLWFKEDPSEQDSLRVQQLWDSLNETSEQAKLDEDARREKCVAHAKEQIIFKSWDQMSLAERKLQQGHSLSDDDKSALAALYPEV